MDGIHDLGGMDGLGPVEVEVDEPVFHEPWEARTFGIASASMLAGATGPGLRFAIERMDPVHYLGSSYYEHWLTAVATLLVERGVIDGDELQQRSGGFPLSQAVDVGPDDVDLRPPHDDGPKFARGETVRVVNRHWRGHVRCPRYVMGRQGTVIRVNDPHPVHEIRVHAGREEAEHTYVVELTTDELWGRPSPDTVTVDLYERYLEPAG